MRWNKDEDKDDDDEVFEILENINPLCRMCAERVDTSMTERTDIICLKEVVPEVPVDINERMLGTAFKCKKFNPISDVMGG